MTVRDPISRWLIPSEALIASYMEMAGDGAMDREGIALWAGRRERLGGVTTATVSHVVLLRGPGIHRARGFISIKADLLNDVADRLAEVDDRTYLVGQIHGHPPGARVDLSPTDILYGIRTPGYLSLVAPNYGMDATPDFSLCGVHLFDRGAGWRRFAAEETAARLSETTGGHHVNVITVGAELVVEGVEG
jgi:hypothetical protein